jgi:hypothetical protein
VWKYKKTKETISFWWCLSVWHSRIYELYINGELDGTAKEGL